MNEDFQNLSIDLTNLPKVEEIDFLPIDRAYLKVTLLTRAVFFLVLGIGAFLLLFFNGETGTGYYIAGSVWLLSTTTNLIVAFLGFKKKKYALREKDVLYKKGLIWSVKTAIPFNRIQHAEIKQGPVERKFKLSSLKIFTAGGQSSDLVIPGLPNEQAHQLKDFILEKTASDGHSSL